MTTQWGAPLTGEQMKLLRAAGLPDGTYKAVTRTSAIAGSLKYADFSIAADFFLPHDSPAYTLLEAGWLDGRNVALWFGGDKAPDDWLEGSDVLLRCGRTCRASLVHIWEDFGGIIAYTRKAEGLTTYADRVLADAERAAKRMGGELGQNELWKAFKNASPATLALPADANDTPKMPPTRHTAPQPETVTIAKMTEAEVSEAALSHRMTTGGVWGAIKFCRLIGLIKPEPTREERFWQAQPLGGADVDDRVKAWVREALEFERD